MNKIAILTNMMEFNPGYSLTGIIKDQTLMLTRYGHEVHLYVNEQFNPEYLSDFEHVTVHQTIPFAHLTDYTSIHQLSKDHEKTVVATKELLEKELADFPMVYTHDFIFTGWFLPYGLGCLDASQNLPNTRWLHWIHSVPSSMRDWWDIQAFGKRHKLVFPNAADQIRVAEQYKGRREHVKVIPHIKDIRTWFNFSKDTCKLIDMMPAVLSSRIMQVLPAGTDRLSAKGVEQVIKIFGHIKSFGNPVCLLIANQWATGRQRKECIEPYEKMAKDAGLVPKEDFAFTSDLHEDWHNGLSQTMIRELFLCSNLFIFPTREESFGLVVPEASLSGVLPVLNKSLDQQVVISGMSALYFDFGSFSRKFEVPNPNQYYRDIAFIILGTLLENDSLKIKTYFKNCNNMDFLYKQFYSPIMWGSALWEK